ncbi:hypothetical protein [Burkholderia gladioli]|uniref:hypothetical protein n=1 Tax=Burkholderia gladioli TaxID=28095 RepID=UPI00163F3D83|nr:hypothetical protein [Burkholderia gladioli]
MKWLKWLFIEFIVPIAIIMALNLLVNFVLTWSGVYGSYIEDGGTKAIINSVGGVLLYYLGQTVHDVRRVRRWRNRGDSVD